MYINSLEQVNSGLKGINPGLDDADLSVSFAVARRNNSTNGQTNDEWMRIFADSQQLD